MRDGLWKIFSVRFENVKGRILERLQGDDVTRATSGCVVFFYGKGIKLFILKGNLN